MKKTKLKVGQAYIIEWLDHNTYGTNSWRDIDKLKSMEPCLVTTIAYLIQEKKNCLIFASTVISDYAMANEFCIVKSCITLIKKLPALVKLNENSN